MPLSTPPSLTTRPLSVVLLKCVDCGTEGKGIGCLVMQKKPCGIQWGRNMDKKTRDGFQYFVEDQTHT